MKISKTMKTAFVAVMVTVGSLAAMSFTAVKAGICVKQTVTLNTGKTIELYYVQEGTSYALYTTEPITEQNAAQYARKVKDTKFEVAKGYEGKCVHRVESLQEGLDELNAVVKAFAKASAGFCVN